MKFQCIWKSKMQFAATVEGHSLEFDTQKPLGEDSVASPKQHLVAALCSCAAMGVVSLLQKGKEKMESLEIEAEALLSKDRQPEIFTEIRLVYKIRGSVEAAQAKKAVELSHARYCSVGAMISKEVLVSWDIELNGQRIAVG